MRRLTRSITVFALVALLAGPALAAPTALERRIYQSFMDGDFARAATLIETHLDHHPRDPVMLYNAACVYCHLNKNDRAASYLRRAVDAGLDDLDQIARDPDLDPLRDHPVYRDVIRELEGSGSGSAESLERWRAYYGSENYLYDQDARRRIAYATALDRTSHREMRRMIERQSDQLQQTLFDATLDSYLLIAVPTPHDGRRLFNDNDRAGGIYEHEKRRLISRDTGSSLRHELVHALHYAHMDRLGQRHPLWVQEGLAALYESYALSSDGAITFLPNERHNIVKGLALANRMTRWRELFMMSDDVFMAKANQLYPQTRSIFEFLADQGKLSCWYHALIENFDRDPTGGEAFEICFGETLSAVERQWRQWVETRPKVDIAIDTGDAALGIESVLHSSNDGVLIADVIPGSAAAAGSLEAGDVIVAVDDEPTRSLAELQTIIATKRVGETVRVRARRDGDYFTVVVRLRPLQPIMW
ncbi:MAG: TPR end-of-group domain-containing protein [Planctomycetota bacterium]|jgi:hypothetical protein